MQPKNCLPRLRPTLAVRIFILLPQRTHNPRASHCSRGGFTRSCSARRAFTASVRSACSLAFFRSDSFIQTKIAPPMPSSHSSPLKLPLLPLPPIRHPDHLGHPSPQQLPRIGELALAVASVLILPCCSYLLLAAPVETVPRTDQIAGLQPHLTLPAPSPCGNTRKRYRHRSYWA